MFSLVLIALSLAGPALGKMDPFSELAFRYSPLVGPNNLPNDYELGYEEDQQPQIGGIQAREDMLMGHDFQHRVPEFLAQTPLWGHQYVQGGAGEGEQRLKPDGSMKNVQVIKTDAVLPAYCNPPNPCPIGYTEEDGCVEDFENTAAFSRDYQSSQDCMCDSEHMFECRNGDGNGATNDEENQLETLARSISNEGLTDMALEKIDSMERDRDETGHSASGKLVAKKFSPNNPYIKGAKLPVVAKKSHATSQG